MSRQHPFPNAIAEMSDRLDPIDADLPPMHSGLRDAAVLVLFFCLGDSIRFLLTVRPETLSRHPGQISLPGGRAEQRDANLWETALRETREELGIHTEGLVEIGRLDPVPVYVSDSVIWPFVAWSPVVPQLHPDANEVARVIEVPLSVLLDPESVQEEEWVLHGERRLVSFYRVEEFVVWGATARILSDLTGRIRGKSGIHPMPGSVRSPDDP